MRPFAESTTIDPLRAAVEVLGGRDPHEVAPVVGLVVLVATVALAAVAHRHVDLARREHAVLGQHRDAEHGPEAAELELDRDQAKIELQRAESTVNRMIMKDNDAGLISGNSAKTNHLLEKISHMDPKTYNRLLDLQTELQKPEVAQWYQTELLFTPTDFKTMKDNVDQAVSILTARKDKGLFLDASVSAVLGAEDK